MANAKLMFRAWQTIVAHWIIIINIIIIVGVYCYSPADCVHRWCVIFEFFCDPWQQLSYPPAMETEMRCPCTRIAGLFAGYSNFPAAIRKTLLVAALRIAVALPVVADVGHIYIYYLYSSPSLCCCISGRLVKTANSSCIYIYIGVLYIILYNSVSV